MKSYAPEQAHRTALAAPPRRLSFDGSRPFEQWREAARSKLGELLGRNPSRVDAGLQIEWEHPGDGFREVRFNFCSEEGVRVPCHLLVPNVAAELAARPAVMICLQGHTSGMHISLGRAKYEGDEQKISGGDRDFALQAVARGYAALVLEQRCFGEREDRRSGDDGSWGRCHHASMAALLLGRTMIGERVWDVSRAIDVLAEFPDVDSARVAVMGNSGGGTVTTYAAALDQRISAAMPSCALCTFRDSIGSIHHCECNYVPNIMEWFEMADVAGLIAPRPLIVVAGEKDPIFPEAGVRETFSEVNACYGAAAAEGELALVMGSGGHQFYAALAWPELEKRFPATPGSVT